MIVANYNEKSINQENPSTQIVFLFAKLLEAVRQSGILDAEDVDIVKIKRPDVSRGNDRDRRIIGYIRLSVFKYTSSGKRVERILTLKSGKKNENGYRSYRANYLSANYIVHKGTYCGYGTSYTRRKYVAEFITECWDKVESARSSVDWDIKAMDRGSHRINNIIDFMNDTIPTLRGSKHLSDVKAKMKRNTDSYIHSTDKLRKEQSSIEFRLAKPISQLESKLPSFTYMSNDKVFRIEANNASDEEVGYRATNVHAPSNYLHKNQMKGFLNHRMKEELAYSSNYLTDFYYVQHEISKKYNPKEFNNYLRICEAQSALLTKYKDGKDWKVAHSIDSSPQDKKVYTNNLLFRAERFSNAQDESNYFGYNLAHLFVLGKKRAIKTLSTMLVAHKVHLFD